jgi:hypothetical protein
MSTYSRLYADADGESHFEDIEIELASTDYAPPAPPLDLSSFTPATQFGFMRAPAGWSNNWHPSSARNIFFVLSGEWEVTASDGEARALRPAACYSPRTRTEKVMLRGW